MANPYFTRHDLPIRPFGHHHSEHAPGGQGPVLAAVAVGGALGATTRYGIESAWPVHGTQFPWPILLVNATGCLVMGALMTFLATRSALVKRLAGALIGTGFLGGYTTFSHYTDNVRELVRDGAPGTAVGYLLLTVVAALLGVWAGVAAVHAVLPASRPGAAA
ncbi:MULTISPECIES: fluoride efflux transporter FluC [unclassified Streptomyces]|uniref:fluoride efflux transporter FluC n=1 Tax=unclassified Streptomyces TaxID=2593676 RepID=UPI0016609054|nr:MULTISPECIES: CrcB family protein [unclassified Streptomyces]MBD0711795.1 chromosome condensation protein CrcB [Streptomyces sp. CBMA291]MBD0714759.1 chromosome condensation protein CrcB [Streptomyces sp. CBMA370]